jgi:uncharacterized membrane protein
MLEIFLLVVAIVIIGFFFIMWIESILNRDDEFMSVKDWHNFRNAMDKEEGK